MSERRFRPTPGGVGWLGLRVVWCPKCRSRIRGGRVARRLGELLEQIAVKPGWPIVVKEVMPDHMHLYVRVGPLDARAVLRAFQGRAARVLRREFACLRRFARALWSPSYFAASIGYVSDLTVHCGIKHQWDAVAS